MYVVVAELHTTNAKLEARDDAIDNDNAVRCSQQFQQFTTVDQSSQFSNLISLLKDAVAKYYY